VLTSSEKAAVKAAMQVDHLFFARYFFRIREGVKFRINWHHKAIADALQLVMDGKTKRLIINVPPGSSKTELAVINFMARGLAFNPRARFLHLSYSSELAELNSAKAKELITSAEFQELFPLPIKSDSNARGRWNVVDSDGISIGGCYATSTLGQVTGFRAGHMAKGFQGAIIIDDPLKPADSLSKTKRDAVNNAYINTVQSRKASPDTPVIVIMQRLADEDLTGFLLKGGDGYEWTHIKIPAIADYKSYWPEKEPLESLLQLKEKGNFTFEGQYQQEPYILGGELIKGEWFKRYTELPGWREFSRRAVFADTAMKTGENNDYTVFIDAVLLRTGQVYILNLWRKKVDAVGLLIMAKDIWASVSVNNGREALPPASGFYIEDKASGTGLIQQLKHEQGFIPVMPVQRTKDKLTRVMEIQPRIESGGVYIPESAPWVVDFLSECEAFTANDSHKHDDQIDPLVDAVNVLMGSNFDLSALL